MNQPTLSEDARAALAAVQKLPEAEQATIARIISLDPANRISAVAEKSRPKTPAAASSALTKGIEAARNHGFERVELADETAAI